MGGVVVSFLGVLQFRKVKTTVNPLRPQDCNNLVQSGIYKYSRNPMYLVFFFSGYCRLLFLVNRMALVSIVIFVSYINHFQIIPEEPFLEEKFGENFLLYKNLYVVGFKHKFTIGLGS
ncbi:MAG: protein-S-isoprenylcysteine O-methyltransferase Ste14 [Bacteriovoracaceae bacterium]